MKESGKFGEQYKRLNQKQKEAVDTIQGPLMVVAGPGTGKTQIITLRIANILKETDTSPDSILALTFTESGAKTMRARLVDIVGPVGYRVGIHTFHGFCNECIKRYPEYMPKIIGAEAMTDVDEVQAITEIVENTKLSILKPYGDPLYYVRSIGSAIQSLKREGITPERFSALVKKECDEFEKRDDLVHQSGAHKGKMKGVFQEYKKQLEKNKELASIYGAYEEHLRSARKYDYGDMIMEVIKALEEHDDFLQICQEKYQYILVDEHQDTNNAQNKVLELLCSFDDNPNVCVVGDEKQAIFRFQGASFENFMYFQSRFPSAQLIILEDNYRSTQKILDTAHAIGEKITKHPIQLMARAQAEGVAVKILEYTKAEYELYGIARRIKKQIDEGVAPHEIAILYRDNKDAHACARALEKFGVPYSIESDIDILADTEIQKIITLLQCVHEYGSQENIVKALHVSYLNIPPEDVYALVRGAHEQRTSITKLMGDIQACEACGVTQSAKMYEWGKLFQSWARDAKNEPFLRVFERIITESGCLHALIQHPESAEKLEHVQSLFNAAQELASSHPQARMSDFVEYLGSLAQHQMLLKSKSGIAREGYVRLMTAHKSKGLEFGYVYCVQAYDGHWGNKRTSNVLPLISAVYALSDKKLEEGSRDDDERRLFFVVMTRAQKELYISYAKEGYDGKLQMPTMFLTELGKNHIAIEEIEDEEKEIQDWELRIKPAQNVHAVSVYNPKYILDLFEKSELSVTALNNYYTCPWKYFYVNLIRIPKTSTKHQMYGRAIHGALKEYFTHTPQGDVEYCLERFEWYLGKEAFSEKELEEHKEKGRVALRGYLPRVLSCAKTDVEYEITSIPLSCDILIRGILDKIEYEDSNSTDVTVVDYKTGKPKTRGEIEGTTKTSNGDIFRQLVFYKLLLEKQEKNRLVMKQGRIDFIEPDDKGVYHSEVFVISDEDVKTLENTIQEMVDDIRTGKAWEKGCNKKDCEFCTLRELLRE